MSDEKEDPRMDMGRNSEHYSDPTPGTAWENMRREEKRLLSLIHISEPTRH